MYWEIAIIPVLLGFSLNTCCRQVTVWVRAGVYAPIKSVPVPAPISFLPPVKPRSAVHTDRQNRYRRLQGGQFREWCTAVNMAPMWNRSFYLLCLLITRISCLDGNEICLTSALNDRPVPWNWPIDARPYLGTDNLMFLWPCIMNWPHRTTNVMHWILFIRQILLLSSTCFEYQVLIFRRT